MFKNVITPNKFVSFIGFNSEPYAVIYWTRRGEDVASCKTVCYTPEEVDEMLERAATPGTFFNDYIGRVYYYEPEPMAS